MSEGGGGGGGGTHAWTSSNSRNFSMDHGMTKTKSRWWPFRSSSQQNDDDDNASVDEYEYAGSKYPTFLVFFFFEGDSIS